MTYPVGARVRVRMSAAVNCGKYVLGKAGTVVSGSGEWLVVRIDGKPPTLITATADDLDLEYTPALRAWHMVGHLAMGGDLNSVAKEPEFAMARFILLDGFFHTSLRLDNTEYAA